MCVLSKLEEMYMGWHEKNGRYFSMSIVTWLCLYMRGKGSRRPMESTTIGTQLILASKGIECPILVDFDVIQAVRTPFLGLVQDKRFGCTNRRCLLLISKSNASSCGVRTRVRSLISRVVAASQLAPKGVLSSNRGDLWNICDPLWVVRLPSEETLKVKANK